MNDKRTIDEWLDAAVSSTEKVATVALGFDESEFVGKRDRLPLDLRIAMVAMVNDAISVQLGIAATEEGCQLLARALLAMEPDEDDLPEEDVADALGEAANIVAGQVKSIIGDTKGPVQLGLPLVFSGRIDHPDSVETAVADVLVGKVPVTLMVLKNASS